MSIYVAYSVKLSWDKIHINSMFMPMNFVQYFDKISKPINHLSVRKYMTILPKCFDHWRGHLQVGELQRIYSWKYYRSF